MSPDKTDQDHSVVFIAGLTHSGSTLLDVLLGKTGRLVGLGEVGPLLTSEAAKLYQQDRLYSCGKTVSDCPFWSRIANDDRFRGLERFEDKYLFVLEAFRSVFGPDKIAVDSSKSLRALKRVSRIEGVELAVVHLARDVRGWIVSRRDVDRRRANESNAGSRLSTLLRGNSYARFLVWYFGNKRIIEYSDRMAWERIGLSYELLVFDPEETMTWLVDRLTDADPTSDVIQGQSESHILLGNRMRTSVGRDKILYDYRWAIRREWCIPQVVFPFVMRLNRELVYDSDYLQG